MLAAAYAAGSESWFRASLYAIALPGPKLFLLPHGEYPDCIPTAMPEEQFTRCPACRTVFRVTAAQLELREGQVRCGHCKTVFDGHANMVSLAPRIPEDEPDEEYDELARGPPTVTLRSAQALQPLRPQVEGTGPTSDGASPAAAADTMGKAAPTVAAEAKPISRRQLANALVALAIPLLVLALIGQAVFHFRDSIASRWPATGPSLSRLCAKLDCRLHPLREINGLSIDASDLQADPAHQGLLVLTATLRNRAAYALAYPYLELSLTDAQDQVVVRRALAPQDYVGGTTDVAAGMSANGELPVKLFIDASATTQAGYRLYLFYP